jgi:UPF0755 protein
MVSSVAPVTRTMRHPARLSGLAIAGAQAGKGPPPPKRSRRARNQVVVFLNFMLSMVIFVLVIGVGIFWYGKTEFEGRGPLDRTTDYMVREGAGLNQIAAGLERQGIISNQRIFSTRCQERSGRRHAQGRRIRDQGRIVDARDRRTDAVGQVDPACLHRARRADRGAGVQSSPGRPVLEGDLPDEMPPEGALLPETYKFSRGTTRMEILEQMEKAQTRALEQIWARRALTCRSRLRKSW